MAYVRSPPTKIGGAKLNTNFLPGPVNSDEFARRALVAAAGAAIATATNTSASQTASQARGVAWRAASHAAASAVMPTATPPQPGTAVNSAARSMVSRMYFRWSAARASIGMGSRRGTRIGWERATEGIIGGGGIPVKYFVT